MSSSLPLGARRRGDTLTADRLTLHLPPLGAEGPLPRYRRAPSRNEVAIVQPVLVKQLENDILTPVAFLPRALAAHWYQSWSCKDVDPPISSHVAENGHASRGPTDRMLIGSAEHCARPRLEGMAKEKSNYQLIYYRL